MMPRVMSPYPRNNCKMESFLCFNLRSSTSKKPSTSMLYFCANQQFNLFSCLSFMHTINTRYQTIRNHDGIIAEPVSIESLKKKKNKKKIGSEGSDWTWRELSDLVKFSSVCTTMCLMLMFYRKNFTHCYMLLG